MAINIKVVKSISNALLNRKEVELSITHPNQATPDKKVITSELSSNYSVPENQICVFDVITGFGSHHSNATAHLYTKSADDLRMIERKHIVARKTGETIEKIPRRTRKDTRIKKYKMFGTLKRNMKKAARRTKE